MRDSRAARLRELTAAPLDVLIVGGGINGAGLLRDLALRAQHSRASLRVALVEQNHFGSGTSGKNSQLIHGGLRYLQYLDWTLVREALRERATLLRIAPHRVRPLRFLLPMYGWKSRGMYGAGLWLYDLLAGKSNIGRHRRLSRREVAALEPGLNSTGLTAGALFWDGAVPSARMVLDNVLHALDLGALALNYCRAASWRRDANGCWQVELEDRIGNSTLTVSARRLVDAEGAWSHSGDLRLVRGSHLVVRRLTESDNAIAHFEPSGRIVFFIPWGSRNDLTLIGTTDVDHDASPDLVSISGGERDYLLAVAQKLFGLRPEIVSTFSSLRPLLRDSSRSATSTSRGHRIWFSDDGVLHIAGGKYTTYRLMSEQAADAVCGVVAPDLCGLHLTAETPLPQPVRDAELSVTEHLSDYLCVSTYLGYERRWTEESLREEVAPLATALGWTAQRLSAELAEFLSRRQSVVETARL